MLDVAGWVRGDGLRIAKVRRQKGFTMTGADVAPPRYMTPTVRRHQGSGPPPRTNTHSRLPLRDALGRLPFAHSNPHGDHVTRIQRVAGADPERRAPIDSRRDPSAVMRMLEKEIPKKLCPTVEARLPAFRRRTDCAERSRPHPDDALSTRRNRDCSPALVPRKSDPD